MFFVDASCRTGFEFVMVFADLVMPAFFCSCSLVVGWRRVTATGKNLVSQLQERILCHSYRKESCVTVVQERILCHTHNHRTVRTLQREVSTSSRNRSGLAEPLIHSDLGAIVTMVESLI